MNIKLHINKTKKGTEFLHAHFTDDNGKRHRKSLNLLNTPENRKLAKNRIIPKLQLALDEKNGEFFNNNKIPTVDEFVMKSINMHRSERNETTHKEYISAYNLHIKDILGHIAIDKVKVSDIKQWQSDLQIIKGLSGSRVKNIRKVLTRMYSDAIDDEIVTRSPLSRVSAPTIDLPDIQPFSADEVIKLISNAEGQLQNFVATACLTGARSGELLGLKWSDIDFTRKEISISRSIKMGVIGKTKTKYSVRTIDMIDSLVPYLKAQYILTGHKNSFVFLNRQGNHIYDIKRIRDSLWKNLLKKCNFEYRTIYHTRHTFATMMVENEDILWVSKMLGHKDSTITLQRYAKYMKRPEITRGTFLNNKMSIIDNQNDNHNLKVA